MRAWFCDAAPSTIPLHTPVTPIHGGNRRCTAPWASPTPPSTTRWAGSGRACPAQAGQGTVEYVGLLMLIGTVIAAVAAVKFDGKDVASSIVSRLKESIDDVGRKS